MNPGPADASTATVPSSYVKNNTITLERDIRSFFESLRSGAYCNSTTLHLRCDDFRRSFRVTLVDIETTPSKESNHAVQVLVHIHFQIYKCCKDFIDVLLLGPFLLATSPDDGVPQAAGVDAILDEFWSVLWNYRPCSECACQLLRIDGDPLCQQCQIHRQRNEWGIARGFMTDHYTCPVCIEPVYNTRLSCGHFIHRTCFIKMSPVVWFPTKEDREATHDIISQCLRCPLCRTNLSVSDVDVFFLRDEYEQQGGCDD